MASEHVLSAYPSSPKLILHFRVPALWSLKGKEGSIYILGLQTSHSALGRVPGLNWLSEWSLLELRTQGAPFRLLAGKLQSKRRIQEEH